MTEINMGGNEQDIKGNVESPSKGPRTQREVIEQDNIFEIEMTVESDIEGGIDIENECIYGYLMFL